MSTELAFGEQPALHLPPSSQASVMCGACGYLINGIFAYCPRCGIKLQEHTAWDPKFGNSKNTTQNIENLRHMIGQMLKVSISDGRVFVGRFISFDKQHNVILAKCREYRRVQLIATEPPKEEKRNAGLVLLGGQYIQSICLAKMDENEVQNTESSNLHDQQGIGTQVV